MDADKKDGEEATGTCYLPVRHADRYGQKQSVPRQRHAGTSSPHARGQVLAFNSEPRRVHHHKPYAVYDTDGIIIIRGYSSRIRYEQAMYFRGHDSLWLDWMVDRRQIWIHDRLRS